MHAHLNTRLGLAGIALASAAIAPSQTLAGDTLLVPQEHATIQAAVDAAQSGDTVEVADGTWSGFDIDGKTITVRSASGDPALCTIHDNNVGIDITGSSNLSNVRGFSITTNGSARGVNVQDPAIPFLKNCRIFNNGLGGVVSNGVALFMTECVVEMNANDDQGGGIRITAGNARLIDCVIAGNSVNFTGTETLGGGLYLDTQGEVSIARCTFTGNSADRGGGLYSAPAVSDDMTISGCTFADNVANIQAGGLYLAREGTVENCRILGNQAVNSGGMLVTGSPVTIVNTLFAQNTASGLTGGVRVQGGATATLLNCTLVHNTADAGGGGGGAPAGNTLVARNCVAASNPPASFAGTGTLDVTWSIVQGGFAGEGNQGIDPQLVDPDAGNYRLAPGSPAIDSGRTSLYCGPLVDLDGSPRGADDPDTVDSNESALVQIDRGAYEFQAAGGDDTCPADVTADGAVNVDDLVAVVLSWGICP